VARTRPAALNTKAVALPDDMEIRQMGDAPGARSGRMQVKSLEIPRRCHRRVRKPPYERGHGKVPADDDNGIGEGNPGQLPRREQIAHATDPAR